MQNSGLVIGPGFQQWITDHQATPLSDELYWSSEMSAMMVRVADSSGNPVHVLLMYNKLSNEVIPFVQGTL